MYALNMLVEYSQPYPQALSPAFHNTENTGDRPGDKAMELTATVQGFTDSIHVYLGRDERFHPLPSLLDNSNDWSLIREIVRGHPLSDLGGLEQSDSSRCFPLTIDSIQLLSITSRLVTTIHTCTNYLRVTIIAGTCIVFCDFGLKHTLHVLIIIFCELYAKW